MQFLGIYSLYTTMNWAEVDNEDANELYKISMVEQRINSEV